MRTIDVIIPAYNAHETIDKSLASVAMQTAAGPVRVIIADDCSDTGYEDRIKRWDGLLDIYIVRLEKNMGPGAARQAGMDAGSAEYIIFLDADDTLVSAVALETLAKELDKGGDVVCGNFAEQLPDGSLMQHGPNMTWMFGKMYRRAFLEHFDISFNATRANGDTGFNGLVRGITRGITFLPDMVYLWHWKPDSPTRANGGEYASRSGYTGFVENMVWQFLELTRRGISASSFRDEAARGMCGLYYAFLDALRRAPAERERLLERSADYYENVYRHAEPYIGGEYFKGIYLESQRGHRAMPDELAPDPGVFGFIGELRSIADARRVEGEVWKS